MNPRNWEGMTIAQGGLKVTSTANDRGVYGTMAFPSTGKWYWELYVNDYNNGGHWFGAGNNNFEGDTESVIDHGILHGSYNGSVQLEGTTSTATGYGTKGAHVSTDGGIYSYALDMDNQKFYVAKNNTYFNSADAGAGTGGEVLGGLLGLAAVATVIPEPFSSVAGVITLITVPYLTRLLGGKIADEITGANDVQNNNVQTNSNENLDTTTTTTNTNGEKTLKTVEFDLSNNITPVNTKKEMNVAGQISSLDESANIVTIPLNTNMGGNGSGAVANSSGSSANSTPAIPSEDSNNNYIALTESLFNVVAV